MTVCARPSGPEAYTESSDLLILGFSRGGIWFITWEAVATRAAYCSPGGRSLVASMAPATIWGTAVIRGRLKTPPSTLTLATRGSRRYQTGCEVPPQGRARA